LDAFLKNGIPALTKDTVKELLPLPVNRKVRWHLIESGEKSPSRSALIDDHKTLKLMIVGQCEGDEVPEKSVGLRHGIPNHANSCCTFEFSHSMRPHGLHSLAVVSLIP